MSSSPETTSFVCSDGSSLASVSDAHYSGAMRSDKSVIRLALCTSGIVAALDATGIVAGSLRSAGGSLFLFSSLTVFAVGGVLGVFAEGWRSAISRLLPKGGWFQDIAMAAPLILFAVWVPSSWVEEHSRALGAVGWCIVGGYVVASAIAGTIVVRMLRWWSARAVSTPENAALASLCGVLAAFGFWLDATLLVGLYEDFHVGLFFCSIFLCAVAVWCVLRALPDRFQYKARVDFAVLGMVLLALVFASVVLPFPPPPRTSLAFAKIVRIVGSVGDDEFASTVGEERRARAATTYTVPPCAECNVLLVTIDALRADHVGAYGATRDTTPRLDALARRGLTFKHAYTQATKTFDSLPSIYSGLYPSHLDRNYKHRRLKKAKSYLFYVDEKTTFLSERFAAKGYVTAAFYGFHFGDFGYHRGFQTVTEDRRNLTPHILKFLKKPTTPFFITVHFDYPHAPYVAHANFDFGNEPVDRYDSEIAYADSQLGKLVDALERRKLLENTIIVVSADHGEEFGEHGGEFHSRKLHEELLHVPLLVVHPAFKPQTVDEYVELVDIAPFLSECLGLAAAETDFDGQSLLAAARGQRSEDLVGSYSQNFERRGLRAASIVTSEWRAIMGPDVGGFQLFDRKTDPTEQFDVANEHPAVRRKFRKRILARNR